MNYLSKEEVVNAIKLLFPNSLVSVSWARKENSSLTTLNVQFSLTIKEITDATT